MKWLLLFLFPIGLSAQQLRLFPGNDSATAITSGHPITAVRGAYVTLTAIVDGNSSASVTFSTTGGTLNKTTCSNTPCTVSLSSSTPGGPYTLTATPSVGSPESVFVSFTAAPTPATTSPHLIITQSMIAGLQAKAVPGSPQYDSYFNQAVSFFNTPSAA